MDKVSITIFTPTYNRAKTLNKCYESLKNQKYKDFEWIIYDDGSSDNTKEIVKSFINEEIVKIRYYYSINKGKHIAINNGTELANGELFFIVDSDDYLTEDALLLIDNYWNGIVDKENFAGVAGRRYLVNRENNKFKFNSDYYDADAIKFNLIEGNIQDKAEVYVTDIIKKYKFVEYEGENFMTEAVIWYKIAQDGYKIRWFNQDIYICEYLQDGLTSNYYKKRIESIRGTCYSYNKLSSFKLPIKYRIRYKINYFRYGFIKYNISKLVNDLESKEGLLLSVFCGYLLYIKDRVIRH